MIGSLKRGDSALNELFFYWGKGEILLFHNETSLMELKSRLGRKEKRKMIENNVFEISLTSLRKMIGSFRLGG